MFVVQTFVAYFQRFSDSLGFWNWVGAAETAAWRMKWISIPIFLITVTLGRKLYRSIALQPERFCGVDYARRGLVASAMVVLLIGILIGVTVPARLQHRREAKEAAMLADWYTFDGALTAYRIKHKTYPADFKELLERTPDPYGLLAASLSNLDARGYRPMVELAAVSTEKSSALRGAAIRKASLTSPTDDSTPGGFSFTTYVLRMPGEDKILGNEDDWVGSDGMIKRSSNVAKGSVGHSVSAGALQP